MTIQLAEIMGRTIKVNVMLAFLLFTAVQNSQDRELKENRVDIYMLFRAKIGTVITASSALSKHRPSEW